jgi:signal transduction histidine kinase
LGLVAIAVVMLARGTGDRMAALFVAASGALARAGLTAADSPLPFAIGRIVAALEVLLAAYVCFAYPEGHIEDRFCARFLGASAAVVSVGSGPGDALSKALAPATAVILAAVAILLARRAMRSTPLRRRSLVPLLTWAVLSALGFGFYVAVRAVDSDADVLAPAGDDGCGDHRHDADRDRDRGRAWPRVRDGGARAVVAELERASSLSALERTMSRAFADPALRLLRWVSQAGCYIDTDGQPADISTFAGCAGRRVSTWEGRGESRAALVHDPILADDVVLAAGSAIRLALDNARLQDDLVSSIGELEASRQRVASAVDEERRRIELDLHDGAQQRLIALRFQLQVLEELAAQNPQSLGPALADAGKQVDTAINQIRGLAKGIHPAVLRDWSRHDRQGHGADRLALASGPGGTGDRGRTREWQRNRAIFNLFRCHRS